MPAIRPVLAALVVVTALTLVAAPAEAQRSARKAKSTEPQYDGRSLSSWVSDLKGAAPLTRTTAAYALAGMGPAAKPAVPALIEALGDEISAVRFPVAYALGEIGEGAAEAVPALEKLLDDRNDDIAHIARKSLKKITGKEYAPVE